MRPAAAVNAAGTGPGRFDPSATALAQAAMPSPMPIGHGLTPNTPAQPSPVPVAPAPNFLAQAPSPAANVPEPRREVPPVGAPATVASPAIPLPSGPGSSGTAAPYVESYDEITYRSKAGDTFANIAREQFNSDAYANALLAYNRSHPQNQSPAADNLRRDVPVLQPGQPVYVPPLRILEKQFPVQGLTPVPVAAPVAPLAPAAANAYTPPTPAPATGFSRSAPAAGNTYQVRQPGESFRDIARRTLGNPDRWYDIARLNPQLPPTAYPYALTGGTILHMPADARVDGRRTPRRPPANWD